MMFQLILEIACSGFGDSVAVRAVASGEVVAIKAWHQELVAFLQNDLSFDADEPCCHFGNYLGSLDLSNCSCG